MKMEREKFESRFGAAVKEVIVITKAGVGAGKSGKAKLWEANARLLAYIDVETGKMVKEARSLTWLMTEEECRTKEKIFNLSGQRIYRLRVRESLPVENHLDGHMSGPGRFLMLTEVVERDCKDERLEELLREFQKPVTIRPAGCSELVLDKSLGEFDGDCLWNGEECMVHLDVDGEGFETADESLATLAELMQHSGMWDDRARQFAAVRLVDHANDWKQEDSGEEDFEEITKEEFAGRLSISEICASPEGEFTFYYDDDDMFWGHVVIVSGNLKDGVTDADFAG